MGKLTFYFDRNFGTRLPRALAWVKPPVNIEWHQNQRFPQEMPDDEWLEIVGKRGWVVFSHDRKFHSEATETAAVKQHSVGCFYLPCASDSTWDKLSIFVRMFGRILEIAESQLPPYVYDVHLNGRIKKVI